MIFRKWFSRAAGSEIPPATRLQRYWLIVLGFVLAGYAFLNKGFAYLGVAPLFVGEVTLVLGLLAAAVGGGVRQALRSPLSWLLIAFALLGAIRTVPYLSTYGLGALRDAVVWGYGVFALLVCAFLLRSGWLSSVPERYGRLVPWFLFWLPFAILLMSMAGDLIPRWPGPDVPGGEVPLLYLKSGDAAVHLAGIASFLLLGLHQFSMRQNSEKALGLKEWAWWIAWILCALVVGSASRAGLLAMLAAIFVVLLLRPRSIRRLGKATVISVVIAAPFLTFNMYLDLGEGPLLSPEDVYGRRPVAPQQIYNSLMSITGSNSQENTEIASENWRAISLPSAEQIFSIPSRSTDAAGADAAGADAAGEAPEDIPSDNGAEEALTESIQWRLDWWKDIINYTFFGEYFWTGKGFGVNLSEDDLEENTWFPLLRSPHNGHITILARAGVPGLALWALMQGAFSIGLLLAYLRARRDQQDFWARLNLWVLAYWVAFMVNMSFDVYLEGPQGGIWFWSLFGFGMAMLVAQRRGPTEGATPKPVQENH
jgi:O-Antigen ligase